MGPHVGYYGGVNYGFGYGGIGFAGGEWRGGTFAYNTAVMHVNENVIHTTYVDRTIVERDIVANPGMWPTTAVRGGIQHQPTTEERVAEHEKHRLRPASRRNTGPRPKPTRLPMPRPMAGTRRPLAVAKPLNEEKHAAPAEEKTEAKTPAKAEAKTRQAEG